ncbi:TPA: DUF1992 domain-containing protein [Proteus mirabilis]|uniref:DnaJ family domain-containing protein n=1 Tax=Proteus TaxID=583 RepID=UPI000F86E8D5|nr:MULTISPECIES: DUF1992 domain-containing protein [Proteus]MBG2744146.1 DUF1992 domain-containing protein [Proteus mirabilis]MDF7208963.1 DUF1992 domain-containing protein [Proteus mirabilis]NBN38612.1 DUF1992 domain-containing protein [Proteus sp. G2638]NBN56140.1 DUF1992 domain-containing protein [Proteus sp. G3927]RUL11078.1 DUF1992 domain-containing protein [Proteus mirabilis]
MSILDEWAERHIEKALKNGELSSLPGEGKPLVLDDNSHVPESLRASYHLLKNAGFLPPEMQDRKDALSLAEILSSLSETGIKDEQLQKKLTLLELKLQQAGMDTQFLHTDYATQLTEKLATHKDKHS